MYNVHGVRLVKRAFVYFIFCFQVNQTSTSAITEFPVIDRNATFFNVTIVTCPSGHMTRDFLSCDFQSGCVNSEALPSCKIASRCAFPFLTEKVIE